MEEVKYCKNCKRDISAKNYVIHTLHCERNIQLCHRCSEPVPRSDLEKHEEEFHSNDFCSECGVSMEKWQIEKHKENCIKKLVPCEYCELEVPLDNLSEHSAACGSRTEQCLKCNKHVMLKDIQKHPRYCSRKEVEPEALPCEHCGLQIDLNEFMEHTAMCGTRTERCLICDTHVMAKDRDAHLVSCKKEPDALSCDYCDSQIDRNDMEHTAKCEARPEKCFLCNKDVMIKDRDTHFLTCAKAQNFNELICCDYCGDSFSNSSIGKHVEFCKPQAEKCRKCDSYVLRKDMGLHVAMCKQKRQLRTNPCQYCGKLFPPTLLEDHAELCVSRNPKCERCDKYIPLKDMEKHLNTCKEVRQLRPELPCKYCGELYLSDFLEDHVNECGTQTKKCEKCDKYIALKNMEMHSNGCKESSSRTHGDCPICHQSVPWIEFNVHHAACFQINSDSHEYERQNQFNECALRKESEALTNKINNKKAPQKFKKCQFCDIRLADEFFQDHLKQCEHREEKCLVCFKSVPVKNMRHHRLMECNFGGFAGKGNFNKSGALTNKISDEKTPQLDEAQKRCSFCFEIFPINRFEHHLKVCQERPYNCNECLRAMPYRKKEEHERRCLGQRMHADDDMLHHEETGHNKELKKLKKCQYCDKRLPDVLLQDHQKQCDRKEEKCAVCLENIPVKEMHGHRLLKCNMGGLAEKGNFNNPTNTYAEAIPDLSKNFERRGYLEEMVEICPSCKCKIPEDRYRQHLSLCYNKETLCQFCCHKFLKENEHSHFQNCRVVRQFVEDDKNSESKKKKGNTNKGKSVAGYISSFTSWLNPSHKEKNFERSNTRQASQEFHSYPSNRGHIYERENITPVHPPVSGFNEVNELPCEFCNQMWPSEFLIEHESGCRPDLVSFPQNNDGNEDDKKFATAAATASHTSHMPVLGANSKSIREDDNDWSVQSRRKIQASIKDSMDYKKIEGNVPQKQINTRGKFFYYQPQDTDEVPKNQPGSFNKKRYPQIRESQETSKIKQNKEIVAEKDDSKRDEFTSFKFSTSRFDKESQNTPLSKKENDEKFLTDVKNYDETKTSNSYSLKEFSDESSPMADYPKSHFNSKMRAIGAERNEKKRNMHLKTDVDVDKEMSLQKLNAFDESNKSEPYKFLETTENRTFNSSMPAIWNTEGDLSSNKAPRSQLLKSFDLSEAKDEALSNTAENIKPRVLDSNLQDMDYDEKNNETFLSSFVESINNNQKEERTLDSNIQEEDYDAKNNETFGNNFVEFINNNQKEENDNDTKSERSNSDDTFYDADDGGAKYFDTINDNYHSSRNQEENVNPSGHEDSNADIKLGEEDLNQKDCDLDAYFQYLHLKDTSCSKSHSEPKGVEAFVAETKTSNQMKYKKNTEFSNKESVGDESTDFDKGTKWRKYRTPEKKVVFSSDSE